MASKPSKFVKQLDLGGSTPYEIIAGYINDGQSGAKDWNDIKSLISGSFQLIISDAATNTPAGVTWKNASGVIITGTLAASSAEYPAMYFVPVDLTQAKTEYNEYIAVGSEPASRKWELIGRTDIDLSQYSKKTHTHTVTPNSLTISATATGTALSTNDDTFVKSYPGETSKLVKASVIPAVANGTVTPAVAVASGSRPTKTVFGTNTTASKVTVGTSTGAASKATAGTATVYGTADVGTAVSIPNVTSNSSVTIPNVTANVASDASSIVASGTSGAEAIATFTPSVDTNGVLSFNFTSKAYKASDATKTTLGTALTATNTGLGTAISVTPAVAAPTTQKFTPYTFADVDIPTVSATDVTVPVVSSNNEVEVAKAGTAVDVAKAGTAVSFATGALDAAGTGATIMTGLGTAVTADALTSASVSTQPTIKINNKASETVAAATQATTSQASA